jgi:ribosome biogenesis protein MAK21
MKSSMPKAEGDDDLLLDADADDDSEDGGFDLDDDSEVDLDDGEGAAASAAEEPESDAAPMSDMDDEEDLGLAEGSDAEDLLDLDADVPVGLISLEGSDAASDAEAAGGDEWGGVTADASAGSKRKRVADERKAKRRKLRSLPTFASAEDYAKLIDEAPEENI